MERQYGRDSDGEQKRVRDVDGELDRWRRAMTRRDRPDAPVQPGGPPDTPNLPSGWCQRRNDGEEIAFVREGGRIQLSATRENNVWRVSGKQRTGEAEHDCRIGGAATQEEALRCLFEAMERINTAMAETDWTDRICLVDAVDGVCRYDAETVHHLVR